MLAQRQETNQHGRSDCKPRMRSVPGTEARLRSCPLKPMRNIELVTHSDGELAESDFAAFGAQCGKFTKTICGICHDRFIIADQREIFWTGASLKDAGRLTFAAAKMGAEVIPRLLESIRKSTAERREYGRGQKACA